MDHQFALYFKFKDGNYYITEDMRAARKDEPMAIQIIGVKSKNANASQNVIAPKIELDYNRYFLLQPEEYDEVSDFLIELNEEN